MAVSLMKSFVLQPRAAVAMRSLVTFQGTSHLRLTSLSLTPLTAIREFSNTPANAKSKRKSTQNRAMMRDYKLQLHKGAADHIMQMVEQNGSISKDELKEAALQKENDNVLGSYTQAKFLLNALRSSRQLRVYKENKQARWALPVEEDVHVEEDQDKDPTKAAV
eukprot:m.128391 g.128391  ORF g.128391 m.128391 type:complete len:164 (-) comp29332_c0_seq2:164-655(-)